ncbi:hypothetical protein FQN49_006807 [Arthroderma sp. PD_2]|nr:hypothetical protein FQN49_006807 [Arthroderma sp. PD_2]
MRLYVFLIYFFAFLRLTTAQAGPKRACHIYPLPKFRNNKSVIDKIQNVLERHRASASEEKYPLYQSKSKTLGTFFWVLSASEERCQKIANSIPDTEATVAQDDPEPQVRRSLNSSSIHHFDTRNPYDGRSIYRRAKNDEPEIKWIEDSLEDLSYISQPKNVHFSEVRYYYYNTTEAEGTVVYMIGSGAELNHLELDDIKIDWLWSGPNPGSAKTDLDKVHQHGTGVLSRIAGRTLGIAKKADIVVVVDRQRDGTGYDLNGIDSLLKTYDHIAKNKDRKVVVNLNWFSPAPGDPLPELITTIIKAFHSNLKNVVMVVGAGDGKSSDRITHYPEVLGAKEVPDLVVVGGLDKEFQNTLQDTFENGQRVKIAARAKRVMAAKGNGDEKGLLPGTSVAAGTVSGLLAYFMGLGLSADDARKRLYESASPVRKNGTPFPWNGIDPRRIKGGPLYEDKPRPKPQDVKSCRTKRSMMARGASKDPNRYYVSRDPVHELIETKFCPEARDKKELDAGSGSLSRTYFEGTPEEVNIAIDWKPGVKFEPSLDTCKEHLWDVLDGCDIPDDPKNPNERNWKSGGSKEVPVADSEDKVTYRIETAALRPPRPQNGRQLDCDVVYGDKPRNSNFINVGLDPSMVKVRGDAWLAPWKENKGTEKIVTKALEDCSAVDFKTSFKLSKDERFEWTITASPQYGQHPCIEKNLREALGMKDLGCSLK